MCLRLTKIVPLILWCILGVTELRAADWLTFGHDPQRSGWAVEEKDLSLENVGQARAEVEGAFEKRTTFIGFSNGPAGCQQCDDPSGNQDFGLCCR